MREYLELERNQKLISELGWLENLKGVYRKDKDLKSRISKVSAMDNIQPHVNELWESFLNLAHVIDKKFQGLSWYINDTELKFSIMCQHSIMKADYTYIEKELKLSYCSEYNSVNLEFTEYRGDEEIKKLGETRIPTKIIYFGGVWEIASTREPFNEDDIEDVFKYWLNDED